ncbi:hypothetical protein KDA11_05370 [Candidatus Saccharibacteria bacterium]|nr:hypothetical protein [Candidatus Saccharibacteria bacterium]
MWLIILALFALVIVIGIVGFFVYRHYRGSDVIPPGEAWPGGDIPPDGKPQPGVQGKYWVGALGTLIKPVDLQLLPVTQDEINALPKEFNGWKDGGYLLPVRDQGQCGGCWAFATTECLGNMWNIYKKLYNSSAPTVGPLSVQYLLSCTNGKSYCGGGPCGIAPMGCGGGYLATGFTSFSMLDSSKNPYLGGNYLESDYPFGNIQGPSTQQGTLSCSPPARKNLPRFGFVRAYCVSRNAGFHTKTTLPKDDFMYPGKSRPTKEENQKRIKVALMKYGPVAVTYKVHADFSTITRASNERQPYATKTNRTVGGHAVLIVGWGNDPTYGEFWWVQNSWGKNWCQDGFWRHSFQDTSGLEDHGTIGIVDMRSYSTS